MPRKHPYVSKRVFFYKKVMGMNHKHRSEEALLRQLCNTKWLSKFGGHPHYDIFSSQEKLKK